MATQRQKRHFSLPILTVLVTGLLLGYLAAVHVSPSVVSAVLPAEGGSPTTPTKTTGSPDAKCAILDQGQVPCPSYLGSLPKGSCWYEDPGSSSAGTKAGWSQEDCNGAIFQGAAHPQVTAAEDPALTECSGTNCDLIQKYINPLIATLSAAVGVVVTISIVYGGIQYASSAGDPQKSAAAKSRITNSIFVLIAFFLLFAFLSWLLPGGLLNS